MMEGGEKHVIHLYEFEQKAVNEKELTQSIREALRPYFGDRAPEIKIRGRPHKFEAYFEVDAPTGTAALTQPPNSANSKP